MTERTTSIYQLDKNQLHICSPQLAESNATEVGQIHFQENGSLIVLDQSSMSVCCALIAELPLILGSNFEIQQR